MLAGIRGVFVHCFANIQTLRQALDLCSEIGATGRAKPLAREIVV
jgi:hypothetical protein